MIACGDRHQQGSLAYMLTFIYLERGGVDARDETPTPPGGEDESGYMASQTATFGIVVGVALLLAGLGFAILTIGGALHSPDRALRFLTRRRGSGKAPGAPGS